MKKHLIKGLLTMLMVLVLVPMTGFAEENTIPIGNVFLLTENAASENAATVYFGKKDNSGIAFRVAKIINNSTLRLISNEGMISNSVVNGIAFSTNGSNAYATSNLRTAVDKSMICTAVEYNAIKFRTLAGNQRGDNKYCDGVAGDSVNTKLWAPTIKDANDLVDAGLCYLDWYYWLCSPNDSGNSAACFGGRVTHIYPLDYKCNVRIGFDLNLTSVLFVSAAEGGKSSAAVGDSALKSIAPASGNELKLTLKDPNRNFIVEKCEEDETGHVKITYKNAAVGDNEYVSYYVLNANGKVDAYAKIAKPTQTNGTAVFTKPSLTKTQKIYIISEQANDDKMTDYASMPVEIAVSKDPGHTVHSFSDAWTTNENAHWHVCTAEGCSIEDYSSDEAEGIAYGAHVYGKNGICKICNYKCYHHFFNGICMVCGYECTHSNAVDHVCAECGANNIHSFIGEYIINSDGTHLQKCLFCEECGKPEKHDFVNHQCKCGALEYLSYDEKSKTVIMEQCINYTVLDSQTTALEDGKWYYVSYNYGLGVYANSLSITGDAHLIIADGGTLTVKEGISGTGHLHLYSQSTVDGGRLNCSDSITVTDLTVTGAKVSVTGGNGSNGNGRYDNEQRNGTSGKSGISVTALTLNNANVTATGGNGGYGGYCGENSHFRGGGNGGEGGSAISAVSLTMNGGSITTTGGNGGSGGRGGAGGAFINSGIGGIGGSGGSGISVTTMTVNGGSITTNGGIGGIGGNGGYGGSGKDEGDPRGAFGGKGGNGGNGISVHTLVVNNGSVTVAGNIGGNGGEGGTGLGIKEPDGVAGTPGMSVISDNGGEIVGTVTVRKNINENYIPLPDSENVSAYRYAKITQKNEPDDPPIPKTGDTSNINLWMTLMISSLMMGGAVSLVLGKEKRNID